MGPWDEYETWRGQRPTAEAWKAFMAQTLRIPSRRPSKATWYKDLDDFLGSIA